MAYVHKKTVIEYCSIALFANAVAVDLIRPSQIERLRSVEYHSTVHP